VYATGLCYSIIDHIISGITHTEATHWINIDLDFIPFF
jgi:hypothetical protein